MVIGFHLLCSYCFDIMAKLFHLNLDVSTNSEANGSVTKHRINEDQVQKVRVKVGDKGRQCYG